MNDPLSGLVLAALVLASTRTETDKLRRRADWGFGLAANESGAVVRGLRSGTPAANAGLADGDHVLRIEGQALADAAAIADARRRYKGGDRVRLLVAHEGRERTLDLTLAALPEERIPGCDVRYGSLRTRRGDVVRTVWTRPRGTQGPLPTLVFIPWLSCDSVEGAVPGDGWLQLLRGIAEKSGWATYRVDKPGVGDSEGADCGHNDLDADVAAFEAALDEVATLSGVDHDRVVIFGGSIGAGLAPVLARGRRVAGIVVSGGFSRTWLDHMLDLEPRRLAFEGESRAEIDRAIPGYADFYRLFLTERLAPAQVLARRPDLSRLWYDAPDGQYGRPATYYHQVQALDVEGAWRAVDAPVLVLHGEYDWIMSRTEADHVLEIVNARHPGRATLVLMPGVDHNFAAYATPEAAYRDEGGRFYAPAIGAVTDWLRARAASPAGGR